MSTTTLRAYLDELDLLLQREALEEVIGHCRHILQHYPKNVETYRLLGKALLEKARHEEAAQVFPRLLSADPNDFVAHVGMSSIYENQQQLNQAIWHMERANEQMPNNNVIINELKRLYKRRDEASPRKIQLTRAALAQQYLSSGMYEQAITELRRSLVEQPNRLDLRVRLATALWDAGHLLEAGELALEVLRVLPDCLPLNLLMAKLWIETRRPDDAKPFLEKVEALAPYESLRLIYSSGNQATLPEGAFVLSRLKWTADAATSVAGPAPDWISQITDVFNTPESIAPTRSPGRSTAAQELPDWMAEVMSPTPADDLPDWFTPGADFGGKPKTADLPAPDDWFNEMASSLSQPSPAKASLTPTPSPAVSGEDELPDWFADVAETAPTVNASDLFGDTTAEAPLPDWIAESPSQKPEVVAPTPSWLDDIPDFTTTESAKPPRKSTGFTGLLAEIQQAEDEELPGWLSEEAQTAADNEPPSIFADVEEFSFGENPDEELEQLRAAARPPSAEEVAALLAMGGRKPEAAEDALPDWLVEESPPPAANEPVPTLWDEETLFEDFGAVETPTPMPAGTPSWLSDAPDLSEDQAEFTTLFEDETPDWLTDVPAQSAAPISGTDVLPEIAAREEATFSFENDDWLMGETESTKASTTLPVFQLDEESPAAGDEIDWLTDAVATDTPSLTLEKVEQESAEEFASLFEDELVTPPPAAEKRLGVTGDLPWRQGTTESSAETGSIDEFAVLFDSQLPQQPSTSTPSRLGVTGDLPWRQDTDSDVFASPGRASSLDEVDWNVLESEAMPEPPTSAEPLETVSEQTPVDDLAAWLNVPPQTSSIAQDVSDEEFTDLFNDDLIPGTAWLDDVQQQAAVPDIPDFLTADENEEVPEWMRDIEPIQSVAPEVTDSELDAMFSTPVDDFSAIGEPSTGWLTELDSTSTADDWASSLEAPSTKLDISDADFDKMFGTPTDDLSSIGEPSTGWLTELDNAPADDWVSSLEAPSTKLDVSDADFDKMFGTPVGDLAAVDKPSTGWLTDFESPTAGATVDLSEEISDDWLLSMPSALSNTLGTEVSDDDLSRLLGDDFGEVGASSSQSFESTFDDLSAISTPSTGWLDDLEEGTAKPESAADWLSSFGHTEPPEAIPQTPQPEFGSLFDDLSEIEAPRTGWLDDLEEGTAKPESAADWLSSFGHTEPPEAIPQAEQIPDWLSGDFDDNEAIEPQVTAKSDMEALFGDLSEIGEPHTGWLEDVESEIAEPESAADWLSSIGKSESSAPIPMAEPAEELPDWLAGVEIEEEPETTVAGFDDLFQDMSVVAEESTGWLDLDEQELEESTEASLAAEWQDDLLLEESDVESAAAPDWLSDDIRLDTSDIQMAGDFDERPARAAAKESEERKPADNIDVFLASITSADQNRITDQTEAMISELDQLTGFKLRELKPEEVEAATRPSSPVPTTLPEEFPDEADFGFDKAEVTPVAPKRDLPDTNMEFDDAFPMQWDEPAKPKQKRGRRLFGKRKEPTVEVEPEALPVATPASFDFDHDPPWLRRQKGAAPSIDFDESAFGEDDDTPPDWFK
ncbi:MAG: hypothetical protein BroJett018_42470 [Chloroflexota bacterium]|nr:hypothetical protein [Chloroflexota bacterium]GIK66453.1 MAG: hypothetical protein BroJett018_42470 [Chloroflexota bacterium]